jgi:hypothetical protein
MAARVIRTMASVGEVMLGRVTFSTWTCYGVPVQCTWNM